MAIYRSDQAQLTFAVEAAPGAAPELASAVTAGTGTARIDMSTGLSAGSRSVTCDSITGISPTTGWVDKIIQIGPRIGSGTDDNAESEIRRVLFFDGASGAAAGSFTLDTPTAFFHPDDTNIKVITGVTDTDADKLITFVPGVYESIEVPDPQMAIEARYYLGTTSKRNPYQYLKGQQTFTGSLGSFVLLDGRALRFPIGKVVTLPYRVDGTTVSVESSGPTIAQSTNPPKKGDVYLTMNSSSHGLTVNELFVLYGAASVTSAEALATAEICQVQTVPGSAAIVKLKNPLQFNHANLVNVRALDISNFDHFKHEIFETVDLDSVSWHVHVRDSSEDSGLTAPVTNDFDRRYHGGKIGNISLTAEEGGLLTCGWDGVNFLGMNHNQKSHSGFTGDLPFYTLMQPIRNGNVEQPGLMSSEASSNISANTFAEPYYFSQGQVTLFGSVIARVRSFSLSIANNEEPRYYLRRTMGRHRGPSEILEQRREYTCSVTLALPDVTTNTDTAKSIFKELLLEGDYGSGMQGFSIELRFDRGINDSIVITIPDDGVAGTGGNNQGAFLNTAPLNISEANPMEVEAEVLFRNLKIVIKDDIAIYP